MRRNMCSQILYLAVLIAILIGPAGGQCQDPCNPAAEKTDEWTNSFTLYLWLPGMNGDAVIRGRPFDVDVSLSDAWDALSKLEGAFLGHYEGSKRPWTVIADLFYVNLAESVTTPLGTADLELTQKIGELATAYEVCRKLPACDKLQTTEVLGGLRYTKVKGEVTGSLGAVDFEGTQDWVDLFVGARFKNQLSPLWSLWVRGDIGGFGIGDSSDFTWNLIMGAQYELSNLWALNGGWRWLDYDYETGSGDTRFEYDVLVSGPFLGFQYSF